MAMDYSAMDSIAVDKAIMGRSSLTTKITKEGSSTTMVTITISFNPMLSVNFVRKKGHTARQCYSTKWFLQQQLEAHHTSFGNSSPLNWTMDTGASHHVAGNLTNLSLHQPYEGLNDILLGDSSGLEITHWFF